MANMKIDPQIQETWEKLSKGKTEINWIAAEFKKSNKNCGLDLMDQGEGGLLEVCNKLKQYSDKAIFGLLKVKFFDEMAAKKGSPYVKFIYFRFLGSKVSVMTKGFLTPRLGAIDDIFPVKHLSYDIDENLTKFEQKSIANDFLRVSDNKVEASSFDFGPQQIYYSQNEKVVNTNKKPQAPYQPKNKAKAEPKADLQPESQMASQNDNNDEKQDTSNQQPDEQQDEQQQDEQLDEQHDNNDNEENNDDNDVGNDNMADANA